MHRWPLKHCRPGLNGLMAAILVRAGPQDIRRYPGGSLKHISRTHYLHNLHIMFL